MPKSKIRKKATYSAPTPTSVEPVKFGSPAWLAPTMVSLFVLGLLWIVVFYLAGNDIAPMRALGNLGNVGVGFGLIAVGFALATRWR